LLTQLLRWNEQGIEIRVGTDVSSGCSVVQYEIAVVLSSLDEPAAKAKIDLLER
jgi:hypothetical protein